MKTKTLTILILSLWGLVNITASGATVSITGGDGHPGEEVTVTLGLSGEEAVSAIDMTLPLDENLAYVDGSAALTARAAASHMISASTVDGSLRLLIYSLDLSAISGTEGAVATFRLRLGNEPGAYALIPSVILSDAEGMSLSAGTESGTVTDFAPKLTVATPSVDFGHVPIRSTYTNYITLCNSGNEPLVINSLTADSSVLDVSASGETIAPGSSRSYTLTFSPTRRGAYTASVEIDCNGVNNLVYGRRQKVEVKADPFSVNELHIERAEGHSDTEVTVNVRVNNMEPLVGAQFSLTLPEALKYVEGSAVTADRTSALQVTASQTDNTLLLMLYSPVNAAFADEDGVILSFRVRLEGRSGSYWLNPQGVVLSNAESENMTSATYGNYVTIQSPIFSGAETLDFGQQSITSTMTANYSVRNSGEIPLVIDRVTFLSDGLTCATPLPLTIAAGSTSTLCIEHLTSVAGEYETSMNVYSNDPQLRMKSVTLSGTAYSPNEFGISGARTNEGDFRVTVSLDNNAEIAGLQVLISADTDMGVPILEATDRMAGLSVNVTSQGSDHWLVLAYSMANTPVNGTEGTVFTLTFPAMELTRPVTFTLSTQVLSSSSGVNLLSPILENEQSFTFKRLHYIEWDQEAKHTGIGSKIMLTASISSLLDDEIRYAVISDPEDAYIEDGILNVLSNKDIEVSAWHPGNDEYEAAQAVTMVFKYCAPPGDIDGDNDVTISDVQRLLNIISNKFIPDAGDHSGDVDNDGETTVSDVQCVLNIISGKYISL